MPVMFLIYPMDVPILQESSSKLIFVDAPEQGRPPFSGLGLLQDLDVCSSSSSHTQVAQGLQFPSTLAKIIFLCKKQLLRFR